MAEGKITKITKDELLDLDEIANFYDPSSPGYDFDFYFIRFFCELMKKFLKGKQILELGSSSGFSTYLLSKIAKKIVSIEGSKKNVDKAGRFLSEKGVCNVRLIHGLWEEHKFRETFTDIIIAGGLEHLDSPVELLKKYSSFLKKNGRIHIAVPNARSLHRKVGFSMGYLKKLDELNERDISMGHKRVYDKELLFSHIKSAGLKSYHWEGIYLKPLSNAQMMSWDERLIKAFSAIGKELPDLCAELYVCAIK